MFFDDGTAFRCARCELDEDIESYEPNITYKEFSTYLLMEGDIKWKLYDENGRVATDWIIIDYHRVEYKDSDVGSEQRYLIKDNGIDIFLIGQKIPNQTDGYLITKSIQTRTEEGEDFEVIVHTVSEDGQELLNIESYHSDSDSDLDRIDEIFILSEKFKTAENIGLYSTIEDFTAVYPDFTIWFSYISGRYVMETGQTFNSIQFLLDGNDFLEEGGPRFESDMTILKPSDFKKGSKIKEIRIW